MFHSDRRNSTALRWHQRRAFVLMAVCWLASAGHAFADESQRRLTSQEVGQLTAKAGQAMRDGEWNVAADAFTKIVAADPRHGRATFYLGYALHNAKRFEEAIVYHQRATRFSAYAATAKYNWACALARLGKKDAAIDKLKESIDFGFVHPTDIKMDDELKSLHGHADFEELRQRAMPASQKAMYRQMDFLLGEWEVFDDNGKRIATSSVDWIGDSQIISEKQKLKDGRTSNGLSQFEVEKQKWIRTWIDSNGATVQYEGSMTADGLKLVGRAYQRDGSSSLYRVLFTPEGNGVVQRQLSESTDGGIEWTDIGSSTYRRPVSR